LFPNPACLRRSGQYLLGRPSSRIAKLRDRWLDLPALLFFKAMSDGGFDPDARIDVLLRHQYLHLRAGMCVDYDQIRFMRIGTGVSRRHRTKSTPAPIRA
jgi:hypothetical protein